MLRIPRIQQRTYQSGRRPTDECPRRTAARGGGTISATNSAHHSRSPPAAPQRQPTRGLIRAYRVQGRCQGSCPQYAAEVQQSSHSGEESRRSGARFRPGETVTSIRVLWTPSRVDHRGLDAGGRARPRSAVARRRRISNGEEFVAHRWLPLSNMVVPRCL
jgi:hypothetical protein